jgi:anti-sigma factor RsiW
MRRNLATEHPDDAALLGYLDAELSRVAMRGTQQHLQSCWKCRSALAELERQAQGISRLLSHQDDSDIARTQNAKTKFLNSKRSLETLLEEPPRKAGPTFFKSGVKGGAKPGQCGGAKIGQ